MKICDLHSGSAKLQRSIKRLQEQWEATKEHWDDQTSREFEEKYLRPLSPTVSWTVSAVGRLAEVLENAERECE